MRLLDKIIIIFFSLSLIFTTLWVTIIPTIKNERFFRRQMENHNLLIENGYTQEQGEEIVSCILDYFFGNGELEYLINNENVFNQDAINYATILKGTYITIQVIGTVSFLTGIGLCAYLIWRFRETKRNMFFIVLITYSSLLIIIMAYLLTIMLRGIPNDYNNSFFNRLQYCYYTFIFMGNQGKINLIPAHDNILSLIYNERILKIIVSKTIISVCFVFCCWLFVTLMFRKIGNKIVEEIETIKYKNI